MIMRNDATRHGAELVVRCFESLRKRSPNAEIVVVDTMSSDDTPALAKEYADVWVEYRGPRGDWTRDMPYFNDAAAARQHSFQIASGRWRGWIDTDDVLPPAKETARLLLLNNQWDGGTPIQDVDTEILLGALEDRYPQVNLIIAPYLYRRDESDHAITWINRERIVRWEDGWQWQERAHEMLVPTSPIEIFPLGLTDLLFLHEKRFDDEAEAYSARRHFAVLSEQYNEGDRTTRRCIFLASYAASVCPERELEFIEAAHVLAVTQEERYRVALAKAVFCIDRSIPATEALETATAICPGLPDAWLLGAGAFFRDADYLRAKTWLEEGLQLFPSGDSAVTPRQMVVEYPLLYVRVLARLDHYEKAEQAALVILNYQEIGADKERVLALLHDLEKR